MAGPTWKLKLLYDSLCPACNWEVSVLRRRDARGALAFEDIADPGFDPSRYGLTLEQTVGAMHAVTPAGVVLVGPDVFIEAYRLVGLGWLAATLDWRPIRPLVNVGYRVFAKIRPRFSRFDPAACTADRCKPLQIK